MIMHPVMGIYSKWLHMHVPSQQHETLTMTVRCFFHPLKELIQIPGSCFCELNTLMSFAYRLFYWLAVSDDGHLIGQQFEVKHLTGQ